MPETAEAISGRAAIRSASLRRITSSVTRSPIAVRTDGSASAAEARPANCWESNNASRAYPVTVAPTSRTDAITTSTVAPLRLMGATLSARVRVE